MGSLQPQAPPPALAEDEEGRTRLPWKADGYSYWTWNVCVFVFGVWVNWWVDVVWVVRGLLRFIETRTHIQPRTNQIDRFPSGLK